MPVGSQFTSADVYRQARALLNDQPNSGVFTDATLLEFIRMAWEELELALLEAGAPEMFGEKQIAVPANTFSVSYVSTPSLGTSTIMPIYLSESESGKSLWIPMTPLDAVDQLPSNQQGDTLQYWAWSGQTIWFPGCSKDRDVLIRLLKINATEIAGSADQLGLVVATARGFLARKVAAMCAMLITQDATRAQVLQEEAQNALDKILSITIKQMQNRPTRRKPFRASRRSGLWRPRVT